MSKINNSYLDFTKQYRNLNYQQVEETYDRINNPVTKLDNFLKTSIYSKRSDKSSIPQSEIYPKMRGTNKPDYYFIEHYPRFKYDNNCNLKLFGQKQTQFHSEIFDNIKQEFKQKNHSFHYDKEKISYLKETGLQYPKDRLKELQETKREQIGFKSLRQEVDFSNRKKRILDGLHNDDDGKQIQQRNRNLSYDQYRNQNQCIEFNNTNNFIGQKMNTSFCLDRDWKSKKRFDETQKFEDTFENIMSQKPRYLKINTERMNHLKFRETGGKDYKIVNLTKD